MQIEDGFTVTDGDYATLAEITVAVESAGFEARHAQIAETRALARAGQLADKQAAGVDLRTKAHEMALRSIAAELAGVMGVSDRTVQNRIGEAQEIVEHYPAALIAWEDGDITRGHVKVIVEHGRNLPGAVRAEYEAAAIEKCRTDLPRRVEAAVEMIAQLLHPQTMAERHEEAAAGRCVRVFPGRDGMSQLTADCPPRSRMGSMTGSPGWDERSSTPAPTVPRTTTTGRWMQFGRTCSPTCSSPVARTSTRGATRTGTGHSVRSARPCKSWSRWRR